LLAVKDPIRGTRDALLVLRFLDDVRREYDRATKKHGMFNSAHEGWAVMFEEVDELWEEVRRRREKRDPEAMRAECVQIAAMALKFVVSCCRDAGKKEQK
jgi:hypothetical protein